MLKYIYLHKYRLGKIQNDEKKDEEKMRFRRQNFKKEEVSILK